MIKSISFPNIFGSANTNVISNLDATKQNTVLLLGSERGELFGDPDFGIYLKRYMFDPNDKVLRVVLEDEIQSQLSAFIPQLYIDKNGVKIHQDRKNGRGRTIITVQALNKEDFTTNTYELELFNREE